MTVISQGTGRVQATEGDCFMTGRLARCDGTERGVNFGHQGSGAASTMWDEQFPATRKILRAICDAGYIAAGQDQGATSPWGNLTAQTRMGQQDTWLMTARPSPGASASKARVWLGISMGATAIVNYLGKSPGHMADCAAMVLIIPGLNLDSIYQNDTGGYRASLGTAWGVTYPTPLPANADPQTNMTLIAAAAPPVRLYVASDDAIQNVAMATANLANLGGNGSVVNVGALGHTNAALDAIDRPGLTAWLRSVAAP